MAKEVYAPTVAAPADLAPRKRPLADAAKALAVPAHLLAGVKALRRWDDLYEVTDAELLAAVSAVSSISMR